MAGHIEKALCAINDSEIKKLEFNKTTPTGPLQALVAYQTILRHFEAEEELQKSIQLHQFHLLLRVIKVSTYNGRMYALNEIISLFQSAARGATYETELTAADLAQWAKVRGVECFFLKKYQYSYRKTLRVHHKYSR